MPSFQPLKRYVISDTGEYVPFVDRGDGTLIKSAWSPLPGSQTAFLKGGDTTEKLYTGPRGTGKTQAALADFSQSIGAGPDLKAIMLRRTSTALEEAKAIAMNFFPRVSPGCDYNSQKGVWKFSDGSTFRFGHFFDESDYPMYHGSAYPWACWEEATTWPNDHCVKLFYSCCRSTNPNIPRRVILTCNPGGVGHSWVKKRFQLSGIPPMIGPRIDAVDDKGIPEPSRRAYNSFLSENIILLAADPNYVQRLMSQATSEAQQQAWVYGSWDIVAGGMFDDVFMECGKYIYVEPFAIPDAWKISRAYDPGSAKPGAVLWFAESNGSDAVRPNGKSFTTVKGDLFIIHEKYYWTGRENEGTRTDAEDIAREIKSLEVGWFGSKRKIYGVADTSLWNSSEINQNLCANDLFEKHKVFFEPADKSPNSRLTGWAIMRALFRGTKPNAEGLREKKGLFAFIGEVPQWSRTVPVLPRDERKIDDVNSDSEDHMGDATRYRVLSTSLGPSISSARRPVF